jgi:predicted transcriptional regulator
MGAKRLASRLDIIKINDRLKEVITVTDGKARFKEGCDDASVAKELNVSSHAVSALRREIYGNMVQGGPFGAMRQEVDNLQREVAAQRQEINMLTIMCREIASRFTKLCTTLALNKVHDVRHLGFSEDRPNGPTTQR